MQHRDWETEPLAHAPEQRGERGAGAKWLKETQPKQGLHWARCSQQVSLLTLTQHNNTYWQESEDEKTEAQEGGGLMLGHCLMTHFTRGSY